MLAAGSYVFIKWLMRCHSVLCAGNSHVPVFVTLMKEALELRKEKSYPITDDNKKVK